MQTQDYPLIFVVDNNFIYNERIASHLRSSKFQRIECFQSQAEFVRNLYKKPDIVIQDYLFDEMMGNDRPEQLENSNLKTEYIFLSSLDIFSKGNNQKSKLISLSDKFINSTDIIKFGVNNYVIKDLDALNKLVAIISKKKQVNHFEKSLRVSLALFFIAVTRYL